MGASGRCWSVDSEHEARSCSAERRGRRWSTPGRAFGASTRCTTRCGINPSTSDGVARARWGAAHLQRGAHRADEEGDERDGAEGDRGVAPPAARVGVPAPRGAPHQLRIKAAVPVVAAHAEDRAAKWAEIGPLAQQQLVTYRYVQSYHGSCKACTRPGSISRSLTVSPVQDFSCSHRPAEDSRRAASMAAGRSTALPLLRLRSVAASRRTSRRRARTPCASSSVDEGEAGAVRPQRSRSSSPSARPSTSSPAAVAELHKIFTLLPLYLQAQMEVRTRRTLSAPQGYLAYASRHRCARATRHPPRPGASQSSRCIPAVTNCWSLCWTWVECHGRASLTARRRSARRS